MTEEYLKNHIFKDHLERYQKLVLLNEKITKIKKKRKPYLIEFLGSARSGKSTSIELIADVLRKHGLTVFIVDEEKVKVTKSINENRSKKMKVNSLDYTNKVIEEKILLYDEFKKEKVDVVIFDRGINDEFVWLKTFGSEEEKIKEYDQKLKNRNVDLLVILTCLPDISLKRKYLNSLSIMPSKWTNEETMKKYLESLGEVSSYLSNHSRKIEKLDSSNCEKVDVALDLCDKIVENII